MVSSSGSNDAMRLSRDVRQRSAREPKFTAARASALVEKDVEDLGPFIVVQAIYGHIFGFTYDSYDVCRMPVQVIVTGIQHSIFSYSSRYLWRKPGQQVTMFAAWVTRGSPGVSAWPMVSALPVRPRLPPAIQELAAAARPLCMACIGGTWWY